MTSSVGPLAMRLTRSSEFHWGREQVLALISNVEEFFEDFYDTSKKKKGIWNAIAENMREQGYETTGTECDKKWRNLKTTYIKVLQKQMHGESNTKFEYFDSLHHILGQEIEPVDMGEQEMTEECPNTEPDNFEELAEDTDDGFQWTTDVVNLLLDYIMECHEAFAMPDADIHSMWEDIALQLSTVGPEVSNEQCQRQWIKLKERLRLYQAEEEATGQTPQWEFYARTLDIMNNINVRTIAGRKCKKPNLIPKKTSSLQSANLGTLVDAKGRSVLTRIKHIESSQSIRQRLTRLEARMKSQRRQKELTKKTNAILVQVLSELRSINADVKSESVSEDHDGTSKLCEANPGSPSEDYIVVEAYADQL